MKPANWNLVDWSKSNRAIAAELGYTITRVQQVRRLRGSQANYVPSRRFDPCLWALDVDWSKRDAAIAKELGCSREAVRTQRLKLTHKISLTDAVAILLLRGVKHGYLKVVGKDKEGDPIFHITSLHDTTPDWTAKIGLPNWPF